MANDLEYLKSSVDRIDQKLSSGYVTKEEFDPVKRTVYGLITLVLVAVVGALLALVIQ
jgi:ABC-type phosphate transport system permease subunit